MRVNVGRGVDFSSFKIALKVYLLTLWLCKNRRTTLADSRQSGDGIEEVPDLQLSLNNDCSPVFH